MPHISRSFRQTQQTEQDLTVRAELFLCPLARGRLVERISRVVSIPCRITNHSAGPTRRAAQAGEFKTLGCTRAMPYG